jgi:hypothetical protein
MTKVTQIRTATCATRSQPDKCKALHSALGCQEECAALSQAVAHNLIQDTFRLCGIYAWMLYTGTQFDHLLS